jgi:hypothetical protein
MLFPLIPSSLKTYTTYFFGLNNFFNGEVFGIEILALNQNFGGYCDGCTSVFG